MDRTNGHPSGGLLRAALLEHRAALLRYFVARQVPPEEAEDVLQDLVVKLETIASGPVAEPRAYLYRMAENLLLDRIRAEGRRRGREQAWVAAQAGASLEADDRPSPEQALLARERLGLVSAALAALPERTQQVFRRYRLDDVPQRRIADELGISLSAVEKHLQKAYQAVVAARRGLDAENAGPQRPREAEGQ
ncbi:MAG: sigma-70 family RNA polymerase sigma factor [Sphingomonadaceae bacterium]|nr:sigma-70 family RNA polymerase sigma factor [Sphingomonadaceae bacterium]